MAVLLGGRVIGLCSRGQIGFIMGARFGFALNSPRPVETVLVTSPLIINVGTPMRDVLALREKITPVAAGSGIPC